LQISAAVDERVFYIQDSFPQTPIDQFAFGLFAHWVPKEVPVESELPKLAISMAAHGTLNSGDDTPKAEADGSRPQAAILDTGLQSPRSQPSEQDVPNNGLFIPIAQPIAQEYDSERHSHRSRNSWDEEREYRDDGWVPREERVPQRERNRSRRHRSSWTPRASSPVFGDPNAAPTVYPQATSFTPYAYAYPPPVYGGYPAPVTYSSVTPGYISEPSRRPPSFGQYPTWFPEFVVVKHLNLRRPSFMTRMPPTLASHDIMNYEYHQYIDVSDSGHLSSSLC
jgi:hypothetical protein